MSTRYESQEDLKKVCSNYHYNYWLQHSIQEAWSITSRKENWKTNQMLYWTKPTTFPVFSQHGPESWENESTITEKQNRASPPDIKPEMKKQVLKKWTIHGSESYLPSWFNDPLMGPILSSFFCKRKKKPTLAHFISSLYSLRQLHILQKVPMHILTCASSIRLDKLLSARIWLPLYRLFFLKLPYAEPRL